MERVSKKAVATSDPFKFLIGPDQTEFNIHSALVAHQSPVLSALVNGEFKESIDQFVKWDDIDELVFTSFWQFAYTGDYDTPEPFLPVTAASSEGKPEENSEGPLAEAPINDEPPADIPPADLLPAEEVPPEAEQPLADWPPPDPGVRKKRKKKAPGHRHTLWEDFQISWNHPTEPCEVDVALKDRANPLVHHAKVYTFADRYVITKLMNVSRNKLHQNLVNLSIDEKGDSDVVELVRFAFGELVPEQLRDLVVHYAACVVEHLWKAEEFKDLVGSHGALSQALIGTMLLRIE